MIGISLFGWEFWEIAMEPWAGILIRYHEVEEANYVEKTTAARRRFSILTVCCNIDSDTWRTLWHLCVAGEMIAVVIERSHPGIGLVTARWNIAAVNSRPAHLRFENTSGSVIFHQVRRRYRLHLLIVWFYTCWLADQSNCLCINLL